MTRPTPVPGRPNWAHLRTVPRLRLHAAMILGICDPRPLPTPMPDTAAAEVRERILPAWWREIDDQYPYGFFAWCHCQRGTCWNCLGGRRCDLCVHRQQGGPNIGDHHLSPVTMPDSRAVAQLIRADDHRCRWVCICPCPKTGAIPKYAPTAPVQKASPTPAAPRPARQPVPVVPGQDALFAEVTG